MDPILSSGIATLRSNDNITFVVTIFEAQSMTMLTVTSILNVTSVMRENTFANITCTAANGVGAALTTHNNNKQLGGNVSPCRTPASTSKSALHPLVVTTLAVVRECIDITAATILVGRPYLYRMSSILDLEIESNAFEKSINVATH